MYIISMYIYIRIYIPVISHENYRVFKHPGFVAFDLWLTKDQDLQEPRMAVKKLVTRQHETFPNLSSSWGGGPQKMTIEDTPTPNIDFFHDFNLTWICSQLKRQWHFFGVAVFWRRDNPDHSKPPLKVDSPRYAMEHAMFHLHDCWRKGSRV